MVILQEIKFVSLAVFERFLTMGRRKSLIIIQIIKELRQSIIWQKLINNQIY
jgi:hypothetical protein